MVAPNFETNVEGSLREDGELIATRESLLSRLRQRENESWREFFETYWKLIYNTARRSGLTDAEAQDVIQETMIGVSRNIPAFRYDPSVCSFKTWLMNLIHWRIVDQVRTRERHATLTAARHIPDEQAFAEIWDQDWERNLLNAALEQVKAKANPRDFQIFSFCILQNKGPAETARFLNVSAPRVYMARHRITRKVAKELASLRKSTERKP